MGVAVGATEGFSRTAILWPISSRSEPKAASRAESFDNGSFFSEEDLEFEALGEVVLVEDEELLSVVELLVLDL